jgi:hypothetical protein
MGEKKETVSMTVRVPWEVYWQLRKRADNDRATISRVVVNSLEEYLGEICDKCGSRVILVES